MNKPADVAVLAEKQPAVGVHSLDRYALQVPDLEEGKRFYENFGLTTDRQEDTVLLRAEGKHIWGCLFEAEKKSLRSLSFCCFAGDFETISRRTADHADATDFRLTAKDAFEFRDFDGNLICVKAGQKRLPSTKEAVVGTDRSDGERGASARASAPPVRPRRLSHVLIFSTDVERSVSLYGQTIGLGLSDRSEGTVAFLHAIHGSDHHILAFAKSAAPGFHHSSWEMASISDVGMGAMNMAVAGWTKGWGFGRHVLGSNFFHYVQDPWGSFAEYSCDIDYIPAGSKWRAGEHPAEDSLYLWGPDVPDIFLANCEIE